MNAIELKRSDVCAAQLFTDLMEMKERKENRAILYSFLYAQNRLYMKQLPDLQRVAGVGADRDRIE